MVPYGRTPGIHGIITLCSLDPAIGRSRTIAKQSLSTLSHRDSLIKHHSSLYQNQPKYWVEATGLQSYPSLHKGQWGNRLWFSSWNGPEPILGRIKRISIFQELLQLKHLPQKKSISNQVVAVKSLWVQHRFLRSRCNTIFFFTAVYPFPSHSETFTTP